MNTDPDKHPLDGHRNRIISSKGVWKSGTHVTLEGRDLLNDLVMNESYFHILYLSVTGRRASTHLSRLLEASFGCMSYPDPRIWCNQIAALMGNDRTDPISALSSALLASNSLMYGPGTAENGVKFIQNARSMSAAERTVPEIIEFFGNKEFFPGYSRPINLHNKRDERVDSLMQLEKEAGVQPGPHLHLALKIEAHLLLTMDIGMNYLGYVSAAILDHDPLFTGREAYALFAPCIKAGAISCYCDALEKGPHEFLPLHCEDVVYTGPASRSVT